MNISFGLDFLGKRSWRVSHKTGLDPQRELIQDSIPSAILPLRKQESIAAGRIAEEHRRGRGLQWPLESQVPVMGNLGNGAGRIFLSAVFEKLSRAETTWGKLGDSKFQWSPFGGQKIEVDAARIVAAHVDEATNGSRVVGLIVPDSLGIAGQQAIISACHRKTIILVPRSIAVALAWCRLQQSKISTVRNAEPFLGYLLVVDMSLGGWSVAKIPICSERISGQTWILPVHIPKLKNAKLNTTGCGILFEALNGSEAKALQRGWANGVLNGEISIPRMTLRGTGQPKARKAGLSSIDGNGDIGVALSEIEYSIREFRSSKEHGECLGVLLTGALASVRIDRLSMREILGRIVGVSVMDLEETGAADGAAAAAYGLANNKPTWLEMVEPLDIYYIGKNDTGDAEQAWLQVLEEKRLQAGSEYRNKEPIAGLKLQSGHTYVQITLRRPGEDGKYEFRKIDTTQGKKCDHDISLVVNVTARPGQGFAEVHVGSKEQGLFESQLDWQKMDDCDEPEKPKLAYIPKSAELRPAPELWRACVQPLQDLLASLRSGLSGQHIIFDAKSAISKLNRTLLAKKYASTYLVRAEQNEFIVYTPLGRDALGGSAGAAELLSELEEEMFRWYNGNLGETRAGDWLKKVGGWWYLRCPDYFINLVSRSMGPFDGPQSSADLHVAGLTFSTQGEFSLFYKAFCREIMVTNSPNNWLKALRNIVKYNEHALQDVTPDMALWLFSHTAKRFEIALDSGRPLIAQNSVEALIFILKRRRYQSGFLAMNTDEFRYASSLASHCSHSNIMTPKARQFASTFNRFLTSEGQLSDIGTLLVDDEDDED